MWRIGAVDVEAYIEEAYCRTAERIRKGELGDAVSTDDAEGSFPAGWFVLGGVKG